MPYWHTSSQTCWKGHPLIICKTARHCIQAVVMTSIFRHDYRQTVNALISNVCMNGKIRIKLSNTTKRFNVNSINTEIELDLDILKKIVSSGWLHKFEHLCTVK